MWRRRNATTIAYAHRNDAAGTLSMPLTQVTRFVNRLSPFLFVTIIFSLLLAAPVRSQSSISNKMGRCPILFTSADIYKKIPQYFFPFCRVIYFRMKLYSI